MAAQTTFHYIKFQNIVDQLEKKEYNINCVNTICNATRNRQVEAASLAASVDGMLVIGGSHSSNTQKLFEICKKECNNTHYIQTAEDLDTNWFVCNGYYYILFCIFQTASACWSYDSHQ